MTAFQFMVNAFYLLVGVVFISGAAVIVYAVIAGFKKAINKDGKK